MSNRESARTARDKGNVNDCSLEIIFEIRLLISGTPGACRSPNAALGDRFTSTISVIVIVAASIRENSYVQKKDWRVTLCAYFYFHHGTVL